jgi:high-affinity nickel-transport protein
LQTEGRRRLPSTPIAARREANVAVRRDGLFRSSPGLRNRVARTYAFLLAFNAMAWILALVASIQYPILLPAAVLAYSFGLRHAVDADHIAAIDNTTRKLMQDGQRPVGVGLFLLARPLNDRRRDVRAHRHLGGVRGGHADVRRDRRADRTSFRATFLIVIGIINLVVLIDIYRMFRKVSRGGTTTRRASRTSPEPGSARPDPPPGHPARAQEAGTCTRWASCSGSASTPRARSRCWASRRRPARAGLPIVYILILPALFAAGMSLVDTTDGVLMLGAYGWAYVKPIRKLYYNLNITSSRS